MRPPEGAIFQTKKRKDNRLGAAEGRALVAVRKEALGREARDGNHGPIPEDGRGCKARRHGGHAHALMGGLHLG